jgi:hypothetical protein
MTDGMPWSAETRIWEWINDDAAPPPHRVEAAVAMAEIDDLRQEVRELNGELERRDTVTLMWLDALTRVLTAGQREAALRFVDHARLAVARQTSDTPPTQDILLIHAPKG